MWLTARAFNIPGPDRRGESKEPAYLSVPASDPAYDFKVLLYCSKRSRGGRLIGSSTAEERDLSRIAEMAAVAIRQTAKNFSICEPAAAEQAINDRLDSLLDESHRIHGVLKWRWEACAEISLPGEVRTLMRNAFEEEHRIRTHAKTTALRMAETDDLRQRWDHFLDEAAKSQNAQHPVRLAENSDDISGVLEEVLNDRRVRAGELITLLAKIVEVQRSADIFELVVRSDTVLRKTLEMMGIELPETEGDALMASLADDM
jgi:hypothetical protein